MDNKISHKFFTKLLPALIHSNGQAELTVIGISMHPTLYEGDIVTITAAPTYKPGDILVYDYKNEGLLIHRLVYKNERYFCKGDNAFRLEDIPENAIIGKVIFINAHSIIPWTPWKIQLSYAVNRQFSQCQYNIAETMLTDIYKLYNSLILKKETDTMTYQKNQNMDFILADETSLAVFDPESGNTYFFDETGIDILNLLEEPRNIDTLIIKLCEIYDTAPDDIQSDVEEFLAEAVQKKVIILS